MKKQIQQRLRSLSLLASFSFLLWTQATQAQVTWTSRTSAADNDWYGVTYGNGLFVAVAQTGTGNRVMTSPDGITWTSRTSAADNTWQSVTYGNGLFVAVAQTGSGNRVMTSPDGITWTSRTSAADNSWYGVTYGNGLFVAVAATGTGNRVMTSPDGITWTSRTSAADNNWFGVTYGNDLFVAVANIGSGNRVMTSPDGITWTNRMSAADNRWSSVTYGNGLFVAVSYSGSGNRVMTSPDGITWTSRTSAADNLWYSVTYGNGSFVAVGSGGALMTSPDGITWTSRTSAASNQWRSVTYSNGLFVAVAATGTGNRVMTSPDAALPVELLDFTATPLVASPLAMTSGNLLRWTTASEVNNKGFQVERRQGTGDSWDILGFKTANNKAATYTFTDDYRLPPVAYYRLRQIDNDGKETLSKVISVQNIPSGGKGLKAYPNPVTHVLTIEFGSPLWGLGAGTVQILNLLGQQVLTGKTPPLGAGGIDVSALPQGTYFLKVGAEQVKFVKQ